MSHADLVTRAEKWLKGTRRCILVVSDFKWWGGECPDAMGWTYAGLSTLVECKASRSDFHADKRKPWRRHSSMGLGIARYYLTPRELLTSLEIPKGWGLLEVRGSVIRVIKAAPTRAYELGPRNEIRMVVNVARRIKEGWGDTE